MPDYLVTDCTEIVRVFADCEQTTARLLRELARMRRELREMWDGLDELPPEKRDAFRKRLREQEAAMEAQAAEFRENGRGLRLHSEGARRLRGNASRELAIVPPPQ